MVGIGGCVGRQTNSKVQLTMKIAFSMLNAEVIASFIRLPRFVSSCFDQVVPRPLRDHLSTAPQPDDSDVGRRSTCI